MKVKVNSKLTIKGQVYEKGQILQSDNDGLLSEDLLGEFIVCGAAVKETEELTIRVCLAEDMIIDERIYDRKEVVIMPKSNADSLVSAGKGILIQWPDKTLVRTITWVNAICPGTIFLMEDEYITKLVEKYNLEVIK